jgi:hypothetical protein
MFDKVKAVVNNPTLRLVVHETIGTVAALVITVAGASAVKEGVKALAGIICKTSEDPK